MGAQFPRRGVQRGVVDEWGEEDEEDEVGLQRDAVGERKDGDHQPGDHQQDRIGDAQPVGDRGHGHDGDEQPEDLRDRHGG